ncbi:MAG: M48 family metalloprotease [Hormoscilla sp. GUM202]|nr:M48 family metalloprotease [Hormoscilla sp. GUM202]
MEIRRGGGTASDKEEKIPKEITYKHSISLLMYQSNQDIPVPESVFIGYLGRKRELSKLMPSIPDNPSLEAGLAALKQSDYQNAIAHLEAVCELELDDAAAQPLRERNITKAQTGLVLAYRDTGQPEKAIAICQALSQSSNGKVKNWAVKTLADLSDRQPSTAVPSTPAADPTGFVPLSGEPTGFVPKGTRPPKSQKRFRRKLPSVPPDETDFSGARASKGKSSPKNTLAESSSDKIDPPLPIASEIEAPAALTQTTPEVPTRKIVEEREWRQAPRAKQWGPLPVGPGLVSDIRPLWVLQGVTAIAFFWWSRAVLRFAEVTINKILALLPLLRPIDSFDRDPTQFVFLTLAIVLVLSPWLMDGLLRFFHGLEPMTHAQLRDRSPDAAKVMQRFCRQRRQLRRPQLGILPTSTPVAITYGNLSMTARIVVSEGLLEQLGDDEIASIYAAQLAQIVNWDFLVMSVGVLVLQIPYILYWQVAKWGEYASDRIERPLLESLFRTVAALVANLSYGCYWLLSLPLLWLSRQRLLYSDAGSVATTGNPNALTRALLKFALGITDDIQKTKSTSFLTESFDLLMPVGYSQAICNWLADAIWSWDRVNPYSWWLTWGTGPTLMGVRLQRLAHYARYWGLETELDLPELPQKLGSPKLSRAYIRDTLKSTVSLILNSYKRLPLLQTALIISLVLGLGLRIFLWLIGKIAYFMYIGNLVWLSQDQRGDLIAACLLISFSISILVLLNGYFPDVKRRTALTEVNLTEAIANSQALPADSKTCCLQGKLLGRRGLSNGLGQDLILQTGSLDVKLHYISPLGPIGDLWNGRGLRPRDFIGQSVTATGWLRRGAIVWLDLETLGTRANRTSHSYLPIWLTIIAFAAGVWGSYLIWQT